MLGGGVGVPETETQEAFRDLVATSGEHLCAHGIVLATPGVTGMLLRSLVRTTGVILRPPYPQRIFASEAELVPWIAEQLGVDLHGIEQWIRDFG